MHLIEAGVAALERRDDWSAAKKKTNDNLITTII